MILAADGANPTPTPKPTSTPSPLAVHDERPTGAPRDVPPVFSPAPIKRTRLVSLDVFRGLTIAMMVLVNNSPGTAYAQLDHVKWHGWTATDLVFPFFLFIVGVAVPFSLAKRSEQSTRSQLLGGIWLRALSLVMLGMLLRAIYAPAPWLDNPETGFFFTKAMRWTGFCLAWAGMFALLVPWPWKRLATWLPIVSAVLFVIYCIAMHFVRAKAIANGWPATTFGGSIFNPDMMRIPGVLQRIGICYGIAATIALFAGWRTVLISALALCTIYVCLMFKVQVDGHKLGSLTEDDNFARTVDVAVLERSYIRPDGSRFYTQKHTYSEYPDNEGIVSTLPAIATALFGILAGFWLRRPHSSAELCAGLLAMAGPVILLGIVLDNALMPINKNLWTPSFSVFCAGMAMLILGTVFWLCDVLGHRVWAWPFTVMGMNAIAAFVASSVVGRLVSFTQVSDRVTNWKTHVTTETQSTVLGWLDHRIVDALHHSAEWVAAKPWIQAHAPSLGHFATPQNESLLCGLAFVLVIFLLMLVLYLCRVFVKV
jgi:predicted acyltransferase